jgi:hypothetical protein
MNSNLILISKQDFYNIIKDHDVHVHSKVDGDIITTRFTLKGVTLVGQAVTDYGTLDENGFGIVTYYTIPNVRNLLPSSIDD